ncbi:branched-chain amino acid ABC transporter permease [Ornithinimicrobium sp. Arc0846-15]|nr:branched-chain amino acid ABC transporter permease [Ornithinimicrobium laminariae]
MTQVQSQEQVTTRSASKVGLLAPIVLIVVLALLPLLNVSVPGLLPGPTYTPGTLQLLALAMLMASLALSYHLLLGVAGLLSFGHALYFGAGVYGLGVVLEQWEIPLAPAMLVVFVGCVLLATALGAVSLRVTGIPFAMVTLAFAQAGSVLARRDPGALTGGEEGLSLNTGPVPDFLVSVSNTRNLYWLALVTVIVTYLVVRWVQSSRAGHVAEATRENELRVRVLGMSPYRVKLVIFVAAGSIAGAVGMVYLLLQSSAVPTVVSADFTISLLLMVVLGGVGSRWGAVAGAVIYTLLNQRLSTLASSDFVQGLPEIVQLPLSEPLFILGTLFVLVVLFLPGGIAGTTAALRTRYLNGRKTSEGE